MTWAMLLLSWALEPVAVPEAPAADAASPPADAASPPADAASPPADAGPPRPAETTSTEPPPSQPSDPDSGHQPGWDDPSTEPEPPAPAPTPAPEPATTPAPASPAGPPELPDQRGTGLLAGAGAAGAVAIGFNVWRAAAYADVCASDDDLTRAFGCTLGALAIFPLTAVTWTGNFGSIGLAAAGGVMRGRYDGISYARTGEPARNGIGAIASGATLLGLGVSAGFGLRAWLISGDFFSGCADGDVEGCMRSRLYGYFAGLQLSATSTAAGAGLLAYGLTVSKYRRRYGPEHHVVLTPQIGWDYTGLSLTGRF